MKGRTAALLAVLALIVGAAWTATRPAPPVTAESGHLAFPGLAGPLQRVNRVEVIHGDQTLELRLVDGVWGLAGKGGYPVQVEKLRGVLTGLTELRLVEPRTSDPASWSRLGVDDPHAAGSSAVLLRVLDGDAPLAELILGHRRVRTGGDVPEQILVRRPNEQQSWLAEGRIAADADPQQWLDRAIIDIPHDRIASVVTTRGADALRFEGQGGTAQLVSPVEHPKLDDYRVQDAFRGLEALTLTDVRPRAEAPGDPVAVSTYQTTDGLTVQIELRRQADQVWITVVPTGAGADALHTGPWVYQVGSWKERALAPKLEDLIEAPPAAAAPK